MSIIYDALKKVEKFTDLTPKIKKTKPSKAKPKIYLVYILLLCIGIFIVNTYLNYPRSKPQASTPPPLIPTPELIAKEKTPPAAIAVAKPIETETKTPPKLTLNGIFYSDGEGYALINNQIIREGDVIDGALVKRIESDRVKLEAGGSTIILSNDK